ncbi:hypothetical protein MTF65_10475 [Streptomyces sp. APSN-46.1]|uniref:hypothetical protein n=1 Tax=Streptomyces sp. APSN-46.1 TaxID=2929049 RepID=UPI001FB2B415|nr:hypothetical protein [Streptomyces sp. APSN-46.1]MCJ1677757.1 hypothetical protein [Streptomyces sp. APSN-46.1]
MLNPINPGAVITGGQIHGTFPGQIHEGVPWWVAACFVTVTRTGALAVAHDGRPATGRFHHSFLQGAINAHHFACEIADAGATDETGLLHAMSALGGIPGALITTSGDGPHTVTIRLYSADGRQAQEDTGLAAIRAMIAADRVPIPVNATCKGRIVALAYVVGADR